MNSKLILPPNFDSSGKTKYPVLMEVYGGPDSQKVQQIYSVGFANVLASYGIVIMIVDGRGTGFKGRKFRSSVSQNLGKYEVIDQITAGRWIGSKSFIDEKRIAIWGWSYGGYIAAKCIEANSGVFAVGIAIAPVTNWKYYDTMYQFTNSKVH